MRLSKRQIEILNALKGTENSDAISVYIEHLPAKHSFNTENERERFLLNLEKRGFITVRGKCFIRLTELGASVLTA